MINSVSGMNTMLNSLYSTQQSSFNPVSQIFDYKAAQAETKAWIDSYKANGTKLNELKKESADFLDEYTKQMNTLNSAAGKLTNGGLDKLLYDESGEVTEDTIKATVDAAQKMVDSYNETLTFLNKNADRGAGVEKQIYRMSDDPAAEKSMEMVGVTVNDDGTLALDTAKLTEALSTENILQRDLFAGILGGSSGIAAGVQRDAQAGLSQPAGSLISRDIATMQGVQSDDPIRSFAQSMKVSGAFGLNNYAAIGILMNMTA